MFCDSLGSFILSKTIPEVQCYALKLDMLMFYACNKIYLKAVAVPKDILILQILEKLTLSAIF